MTVLIVSADSVTDQAQAGALAEQLRAAGMAVLAVVPCHMLVREVVRLAPQSIVALAGGHGVSVLDALTLLAASAPRPVVLLDDLLPPADPAPWLDAQVMAWLPGPTQPSSVLAALALGLPRFARQQAQAGALQAALARLEERKWVDRAKGMLMRQQKLSEDDAFTLLRTASMQANLRVGEVSRSVIEAAQAAEAVNLAGQLRMLSQRCIKALALRACAPGRARADEGLAETLQRLQANLDHLVALQTVGPVAACLNETLAAWKALQQVAQADTTARRPAAARADTTLLALGQADQRAETLLGLADKLTSALELASGRRSLQVVNLCGRQRMLSQRLAKQALLAGLLPDDQAAAQAAAAALTIRDFEATLVALEQMPLATETIRAALAQSRGQWQRLLEGLRRAAGPDVVGGRAALARESDALLAGFEQLTTLYEHSLQVLMG